MSLGVNQDLTKVLLEIVRHIKKSPIVYSGVYKSFYFDLYIRFLITHKCEMDFIEYHRMTLKPSIRHPFDFPIKDEELRDKWILQIYNLNKSYFNQEWRNLLYLNIEDKLTIINHPIFGTCVEGNFDDLIYWRSYNNFPRYGTKICPLPNKSYKIVGTFRSNTIILVDAIMQFYPLYLQEETTFKMANTIEKEREKEMIKRFIMEEIPKI